VERLAFLTRLAPVKEAVFDNCIIEPSEVAEELQEDNEDDWQEDEDDWQEEDEEDQIGEDEEDAQEEGAEDPQEEGEEHLVLQDTISKLSTLRISHCNFFFVQTVSDALVEVLGRPASSLQHLHLGEIEHDEDGQFQVLLHVIRLFKGHGLSFSLTNLSSTSLDQDNGLLESLRSNYFVQNLQIELCGVEDWLLSEARQNLIDSYLNRNRLLARCKKEPASLSLEELSAGIAVALEADFYEHFESALLELLLALSKSCGQRV